MEKFAIGLMVGGIVGAVLTANNYKMRTLVKKSQQEVQNKLDKLLDEKIACIQAEEDETPSTPSDKKTAKS